MISLRILGCVLMVEDPRAARTPYAYAGLTADRRGRHHRRHHPHNAAASRPARIARCVPRQEVAYPWLTRGAGHGRISVDGRAKPQARGGRWTERSDRGTRERREGRGRAW